MVRFRWISSRFTVCTTLSLVILVAAIGLYLAWSPEKAGAAHLTIGCQAGPNPFPSEMGTYWTYPVKENSPYRLQANVSGGTPPYTYAWYRTGGTLNGYVSGSQLLGSGSTFAGTTTGPPGNGYGWWNFEIRVTDAGGGNPEKASCGFHVLPNPANRLDPDGNAPSVNPVLWFPKDTFPGDAVPPEVIDQAERALGRIRAGYHEILGKTFHLNPLKVVVSASSERDLCGGDCTDLQNSNAVVYNKAYPDAKNAVGCEPSHFGCIYYTREMIVMVWGAGGWAGGYGSDYAWGAIGDWPVATTVGLKTPHLEPDVSWQLDGIGLYDPNFYTLAHEMNHNISWDDPHNFSLDTPQTTIEKNLARALPWMYEDLPETINPTVSISSPASGATIGGTTNVNVSASDAAGIDAVVLTVDGYWYGADTTPPYSFAVDTTKIGHGDRNLTAIAYDNNGHMAKVQRTVNVSNQIAGSCPTTYPTGTAYACYFDGNDLNTYLGTLRDPPNLVTDNGNYGLWPSHTYTSGVAFGQVDTVSARWLSRLDIPAGNYIFHINSDDGVRLYINDVLVLNEWHTGAYYYAVPVTINGPTNVKLEWYQNTGSKSLKMRWQPTNYTFFDDFTTSTIDTTKWQVAASGETASIGAGKLRLIAPQFAPIWSYAEVASLATFPLGTVFEARVSVPGIARDRTGFGFANARIGTNCASGETEALLWRAQDTNKYVQAETGGSSLCPLVQSGYSPGWRTIRIDRVHASAANIYENDVKIDTGAGAYTFNTNIPAGALPIRLGTFSAGSLPVFTMIEVDWVKASTPTNLAAQALSVSPYLGAGDQASFFASVRNTGGKTARSSEARLRIDAGNNGTWDVVVAGNQPSYSLTSRALEAEAWPNAWTTVEGTHRFEVCADTLSQVSESNETDNCTTQTFTVLPARPNTFAIDAYSADQVALSWSEVPGAVSYERCVSNLPQTEAWICVDVGNITSEIASAPTAHGVYYFAVRAVNGAGVRGRLSMRATISVDSQTVGGVIYNSYFTAYKALDGTKMVNAFNRGVDLRYLALWVPTNTISGSVSGGSTLYPSSQPWNPADWLTIYGPIIGGIESPEADLTPSTTAYSSTLCMVVDPAYCP